MLVGAGAAVAVAGTTFALLARDRLDALGTSAPVVRPATPELVRDTGKTFQAVSIGLLGAAGALIVGGLVWRLVLPRAPVTASASLGPGGCQLALSLEWP